MSFPRYPKYKDSGVEWLTTVPAHWGEVRGDAVIREKYESNKGMLSDNLLSLSFGRIVRKDVFSNDGLLPESFETYQVVEPGDIVFRPTDLQNDWNSLRSAIVEERGIITSAYIAVTSSVAVPRYLHYLFRAYDHTKVFYSMGGGLRQAFKFADLRRLPVLMPPLPEQTAIATFLDCETAKIDSLIAEQQRLIELLQEKRQAVISHAVTKGLNPNAPMKDSGIKWLGEVPEHWTNTRVKFASSRISKGDTPSNFGMDFAEDGPVRFIKIENIGNGSLIEEPRFTINIDAHDKLKRSQLQAGDVVFAIAGATTGKCAVVAQHHVPANTNQAVAFIRPNSQTVSDFLVAWLQSRGLREAMWEMTVQSAQPNLSMENLGNLPLLLPPAAEQVQIVQEVVATGGRYLTLIAEEERAVSLLLERRSALISAAVTGQIDVRGLAGSEAA